MGWRVLPKGLDGRCVGADAESSSARVAPGEPIFRFGPFDLMSSPHKNLPVIPFMHSPAAWSGMKSYAFPLAGILQ